MALRLKGAEALTLTLGVARWLPLKAHYLYCAGPLSTKRIRSTSYHWVRGRWLPLDQWTTVYHLKRIITITRGP